jgi:hypothetical protein
MENLGSLQKFLTTAEDLSIKNYKNSMVSYQYSTESPINSLYQYPDRNITNLGIPLHSRLQTAYGGKKHLSFESYKSSKTPSINPRHDETFRETNSPDYSFVKSRVKSIRDKQDYQMYGKNKISLKDKVRNELL